MLARHICKYNEGNSVLNTFFSVHSREVWREEQKKWKPAKGPATNVSFHPPLWKKNTNCRWGPKIAMLWSRMDGLMFCPDLCVYPPSNNSYTLFQVGYQKTLPQKKYDPALKQGVQLATIESIIKTYIKLSVCRWTCDMCSTCSACSTL